MLFSNNKLSKKNIEHCTNCTLNNYLTFFAYLMWPPIVYNELTQSDELRGYIISNDAAREEKMVIIGERLASMHHVP